MSQKYSSNDDGTGITQQLLSSASQDEESRLSSQNGEPVQRRNSEAQEHRARLNALRSYQTLQRTLSDDPSKQVHSAASKDLEHIIGFALSSYEDLEDDNARKEERSDFGEWKTAGIEIVALDISYTVPAVERSILSGVTFQMSSGSMCALMGASGAGKTTLLDVVSGRKSDGEISGELTFNGHPRDKYFKRISAYVMQDDVFIPTLSVEETLTFSSMLRMPQGTAWARRKQRVEEMLEMLGLDHIRGTVVGDQVVRGISGGQRKRLSIGVEIIGLPTIIFLDEPTSGLDSEISFEVMESVRSITDQNRTVCATIHQPSPETFGLFDQILLMAKGKVVYFGPTRDIVKTFSSPPYTYKYMEGTNPADFVVRVAGGKFIPLGSNEAFSAETLHMMYLETPHHKDLISAISDRDVVVPPPLTFERELPTSQLTQLRVLVKRGFTKTLRDRAGLETAFGRTFFGAMLMGSLFFGQNDCGSSTVECEAPPGVSPDQVLNPGSFPHEYVMSDDCCVVINGTAAITVTSRDCLDCQSAVFNRFSVLFFAMLFKMMGNMDAIADMCNDRILFYRERSAGAYKTLPYMITSVVVNLPVLVLTSCMFSSIYYFMIGFYMEADAFLYFLLIIFMCQFTGFQFAQLLAAAAENAQVALAIFPGAFVFFNIFAGFLIHIPDVPVYWSWAPVASFARWAIQGLVLNEFDQQPQLRYFNGVDVLHDYGYHGYSKFTSVYFLFGTIILFSFMTQMALCFIRHGSA